MALSIKIKSAITRDSKTLVVTDKTGAYVASLNEGGWGAPNVELDQSCLVFIAQRMGTEETTLLASSNTVLVFDSGAANTKETSVNLNFTLDGVYHITICRLPVSNDGINVLEGSPIASDSYFYWNSKVWKMVSSTPNEITDISELVGVNSVVQNTCLAVLYPMLAIKRQSIYKKYRLSRDKACDDAEDLKEEFRKLYDDLVSVSYTAWSGLEVEAQDQIESLIDYYQITPNQFS